MPEREPSPTLRTPLRHVVALAVTGAIALGTVGTGLLLAPATSAAPATPPDAATHVEQLLQPAAQVQGVEAQTAPLSNAGTVAPTAPQTPPDASSPADPAAAGLPVAPPVDPEETVTVIVRTDEPAWWDLVGTQQRVLDEVATAGETQQRANRAAAVTHTYDTAFHGFALTAPRWALERVQNVQGVQSAFVELRYATPAPQPTAAPDFEGYEWQNGSSLAMTGADQATTTGEGMLISILDTGLDTSHEAFGGQLDEGQVALTQADLDDLRGSLEEGARATWISSKVPFAYDYADHDDDVTPGSAPADLTHGTHVAGLAAANGGDSIRGTAPDAQLLIQKVFDSEGFTSDSVLLAALDDAAELRPDVVNLSLGSSAGFSVGSDNLYTDVYDVLRDRGIIVNAAAGNSQHAAVANQSGRSLPYATDPDYGIVAAPSSYDRSLSIASIDNSRPRPFLLAGDGSHVRYVDTQPVDGGTVPPLSSLPEGTYSYVDAGVGSTADVAELQATGASTSGAIVLVHRGGEEFGELLTFQHKLDNTAPLQPAAVVFVDNVDGALPTPSASFASVPSGIVSRAAGETLLAAAARTLQIGPALVDAPDTAYRASSFSSMGVTPELKLKPDVSAPGGSIFSAMPGGGYDVMSGTSMAAPQLAGILALVKQAVLENPDHNGLDEQAAGELAQRLVMNTAQPVLDPTANGAPYSPRKQGAGLANVPAASASPVSLSVTGAADGRPSASLGDSVAGEFTFEIVAHNSSAVPQTYQLSASALSDRIADGLFQADSVNWAGRGIDVSFGGGVTGSTLTIPEGGSAAATVSVRAEQAFEDGVAAAVNGTFIDGFVQLTSASAPALTVPYLGFYGSWAQSPVFDAPLASGQQHVYGSSLVNSATGVPIGVNPLDETAQAIAVTDPSVIDPDRAVVSPTRYSLSNSSVQPVTGLLRNAEKLTYELVKDADDAVATTYSFDKVIKSALQESTGQILYGEARLPQQPVFGAFGQDGTELTPGPYTLQQTAVTSGPGSTEQRFTTKLTYDNAGARVERSQLSADGTTLDLVVSDDSWIASFDLQEFTGAGYFHRTLGMDPTRSEGGRQIYELSIPLEAIRASWNATQTSLGTAEELPPTAYLYVWDYGLNLATPLAVTLFESAPTGVTLDQASLQLAPDQRATLTARLEPANATATPIAWASSDASVATVDAEGEVLGRKPGTTKLTATVQGTQLSASVDVTVAEVEDAAGIALSVTSLTLAEGSSSSVQALLAPSLKGTEVTWASSDEAIATVTSPGAEASVEAVKRGEARITASATRPDGSTATAEVALSVRQSDYADYAVVDGELQAYIGTRSVIDVPPGVTSIADGALAGAGLIGVNVPASVERIGADAFREMGALQWVRIADGEPDGSGERSRLASIGSNAFRDTRRLREVDLPGSLREIGTGSFSNTVIEKIVLAEGVTIIPANAFSGALYLNDVTMEGDVTEIHEGAFAATTALTGIDLPDSVVSIGDSAFVTSALTSLVLPASTVEVGGSAFAGNPLRTLDLSNVERVGSQSFSQTQLTNVVLPDTLKAVGAAAFAYNSQLAEVRIGRNVEAGSLIGVFSADGGGSATPRLARFVVPDDVANYSERDGILYDKQGSTLISYPQGAFTGTELRLPDGTTRVERYALLGTQARSVVLPEGLASIAEGGFAVSQLERLTVPNSLTSIETGAFANSGRLASISLNQVETLGARAFAYNAALVDVDLGTRLREIGESTFEADTALTSFTVSDSVERIADGAFLNAVNISRMHIGASVSEIGSNVLTGIPGLRELTVSPENAHYYTDENVLYGQEADGLHLKLYLPAKTDTAYEVVAGTVAVDAQAFRSNASLERVVLPEGVRTLGTGAFNSMPSLREVVLPDSLEVVNGFYFATQLRSLDFGTKIRSFESLWSMGTTLDHLVVRGGVDGRYVDSFGLGGRGKTAYFGPGMTHISYQNETPETLVVPGDLQELDLQYALPSDAFRVYAPAGSPGAAAAAAALEARGLDSRERLLPYTALSSTLQAAQGADGTVTAVATPTGGVLDVAGTAAGYEFRFATVDAEGTRTVVRDWGAGASWSGAVAPGSALTVETRDATQLTATASWAQSATAPVVVAAPTDVGAPAGGTAEFSASATGDPAPTVQWQSRVGDGGWADIAGATEPTLRVSSVTAEQDGLQVRAVFANAFGTAASAPATLTVTAKPVDPTAPGEPGEPGGEQPVDAPAAPTLDAGNRGDVAVSAQDGATFTVNLGGDRAGDWIGVTLHDESRFLGWMQADTTGTLTVALPADVKGAHRLSFVDRNGGLVGWVDAVVKAAETPGEPGGTTPPATPAPGTPTPVVPAPEAAAPGGSEASPVVADGADALATTGETPQLSASLLLTLAGLSAVIGFVAFAWQRRTARR